MQMLRYSSSFLDRLEEVGDRVRAEARAPMAWSGRSRVLRACSATSASCSLTPHTIQSNSTSRSKQEGDGYARLRVFFREAEQSAAIIRQVLRSPLPGSGVRAANFGWRAGAALGAVEAPQGAAFHWLRIA